MVQTPRLKLSFYIGRKTVLTAQNHTENQTGNFRPPGKWRFQPALNPTFDSIGCVPSPVQNRDEARVPDRAGPVDALSLQMAPVVEHPRILVHTRAM